MPLNKHLNVLGDIMNIFKKLSTLVLPLLSSYKDDLLVHDKEAMEQHYKGEAIHGVRSTGTNILIKSQQCFLDNAKPMFGNAKPSLEIYKANVEAFLFSNEIFFHSKGDEIKEISKEEAMSIYKSWLPLVEEMLESKRQREFDSALALA